MKLIDKSRGNIENLPAAPVVILARPQLGENVGTAARAMLNFGLTELRLVNPRFGWPNTKAVAASSGAHGILNAMSIHNTLAEAADDLHHVFATTARPREMTKPVMEAHQAASKSRIAMAEGRRVGLLFGPERTGLDNDELALADAIVTIPLNPAFPSLNLAQAVLLVGYEWFQSGDIAPAMEAEADPPATKGDLARLLDHLSAELEDVGFFRSETRKASLTRTIKLMFERRQMTAPEVHLFHGIIKDLRRGKRKV